MAQKPSGDLHQVKDGVYEISFNGHALGRFSSKDLQKGIEIPVEYTNVSSEPEGK